MAGCVLLERVLISASPVPRCGSASRILASVRSQCCTRLLWIISVSIVSIGSVLSFLVLFLVSRGWHSVLSMHCYSTDDSTGTIQLQPVQAAARGAVIESLSFSICKCSAALVSYTYSLSVVILIQFLARLSPIRQYSISGNVNTVLEVAFLPFLVCFSYECVRLNFRFSSYFISRTSFQFLFVCFFLPVFE